MLTHPQRMPSRLRIGVARDCASATLSTIKNNSVNARANMARTHAGVVYSVKMSRLPMDGGVEAHAASLTAAIRCAITYPETTSTTSKRWAFWLARTVVNRRLM